MVARKQSAFGGYNMSTGVKAHVAGSCGCKAGWFEMFPRLCKVDGFTHLHTFVRDLVVE